MKKVLAYLASALLMTLSCSAIADAQNIVRGPYLQMPTQDGITIRWRTDIPVEAEVYFHEHIDSILFNKLGLSGMRTEHELRLADLDPGKKYFYALSDGKRILSLDTSRQYFFTLLEKDTEEKITVWVIGDFGKGNKEQIEVKQSFLDYTDDKLCDFWIWLGDNAYDSGTDMEYQAKVFDSTYGYQEIFPRMPFMPTPGNHDYVEISPIIATVHPDDHQGAYFDIVNVPALGEMGGRASGTELYYSFDYGNAHFISLNSELGSVVNANHDWTGAHLVSPFRGSPMQDWLVKDLEENKKKWTVVYFHQPPYTDGSHNSTDGYEVYMSAMRKNYLPILEAFGVDLVMCGHSHVYERSYLLEGFYGRVSEFDRHRHIVQTGSGNLNFEKPYYKYLQGGRPNRGTVYLVQGNSGSKTSSPNLSHPAIYFEDGCGTCVGSTILSIEGDTMTGRYLHADKGVLDEWTIVKLNESGPAEELGNSQLRSFSAGPNPFRSNLNVYLETSATLTAKLELIDMRGKYIRTLWQGVLEEGKHTIELGEEMRLIDAGVYTIRIRNEQLQSQQRLIKY